MGQGVGYRSGVGQTASGVARPLTRREHASQASRRRIRENADLSAFRSAPPAEFCLDACSVHPPPLAGPTPACHMSRFAAVARPTLAHGLPGLSPAMTTCNTVLATRARPSFVLSDPEKPAWIDRRPDCPAAIIGFPRSSCTTTISRGEAGTPTDAVSHDAVLRHGRGPAGRARLPAFHGEDPGRGFVASLDGRDAGCVTHVVTFVKVDRRHI